MPRRYPEPQIRRKADTGAYFVRWGGKDHYLARDAAAAERLWADPSSAHPGSRAAWLRWRAARLHALESTRHAGSAPRSVRVVEAAERMLAVYEAEGRAGAAAYFRTHLARFLHVHGAADLVTLASPAPERYQFQPPIVPLLEAFKTDLAGAKRRLEPRTINHDLTAVKRLFNWAAEQGHCPEVRWRGVKRLPVRRSEPEDLPLPELARRMEQLRQRDEHLWRYAVLNYLTLARPSEVVRLVCDACAIRDAQVLRAGGEPIKPPKGRHRRRPARPIDPRDRGRFLPVVDHLGASVDRGLFELRLHKGTWRVHRSGGGEGGEGGGGSGGGGGPSRFLVLTPRAVELLDSAAPIWSTLDGYSSAVAHALPGFGPRMLRDSAASHLRALGVDLADVQTLLGHAPRGEWPSYARTPWSRLRAVAARLTL